MPKVNVLDFFDHRFPLKSELRILRKEYLLQFDLKGPLIALNGKTYDKQTIIDIFDDIDTYYHYYDILSKNELLNQYLFNEQVRYTKDTIPTEQPLEFIDWISKQFADKYVKEANSYYKNGLSIHSNSFSRIAQTLIDPIKSQIKKLISEMVVDDLDDLNNSLKSNLSDEAEKLFNNYFTKNRIEFIRFFAFSSHLKDTIVIECSENIENLMSKFENFNALKLETLKAIIDLEYLFRAFHSPSMTDELFNDLIELSNSNYDIPAYKKLILFFMLLLLPGHIITALIGYNIISKTKVIRYIDYIFGGLLALIILAFLLNDSPEKKSIKKSPDEKPLDSVDLTFYDVKFIHDTLYFNFNESEMFYNSYSQNTEIHETYISSFRKLFEDKVTKNSFYAKGRKYNRYADNFLDLTYKITKKNNDYQIVNISPLLKKQYIVKVPKLDTTAILIVNKDFKSSAIFNQGDDYYLANNIDDTLNISNVRKNNNIRLLNANDQGMEEFYDFTFLDGRKISDQIEITVDSSKSKLMSIQRKYKIALLQGIDNSKMVIGIIGFDLYYHCHIRPKNTLELYKVSRFRNEPKKDKYENETMVLIKK